MISRLEKIRQDRLEKLEKLRQLDEDPYPPRSYREDNIQAARNQLSEKVNVAGRIMAWRPHGGSTFADVRDYTGEIQVFFAEDELGEEVYKKLELLDIGDFIAVAGVVFETNRGEVSVKAEEWQILAKTLRPLPNKWQGLKDVETRSRQRYLDLIANEKSREVFKTRSLAVRRFRQVLEEKGFLEVETPTLQPIYGGAAARPFITHHEALDQDLYLKISDELYLKRLIIGGLGKVYEIDHNFRNEGIDRAHNPEFTLMECYQAYADYRDMMDLTEEIYTRVAETVLGTTEIKYQEQEIDLSAPWRRMTMYEAIEEYLGWQPKEISDDELRDRLAEQAIEIPGGYKRGLAIAALFEQVEEKLVQPTFITDYPKETTALCKPKPDNSDLIERFEPYIAGFEVGNAYTELNDPQVQREFFEAQVAAREAGDEEAHPLDEGFLEALEYGMPPTGGLGLSVDRMIMLLTDQANIRDVILFPTLKKKDD